MNAASWMAGALTGLDADSVRRRLVERGRTGGWVECNGRRMMNLASNDYLNVSNHPRVLDAARRAMAAFGAGATASRLICGHLPCHAELERRLARLKRCPAALAFASGYAANLGVIPALCRRGDTVFADRLAHASLLDGIRLSGASLRRFRHNDAEHLAALLRAVPGRGRTLIVTESVFSMDGDLAPLDALVRLAEGHGAMLMVDEAHATGVYGPGGAGRVVEAGLQDRVTVSMGTLSKALGASGGFVAGNGDLRDWLLQRARSFIYSTGLPPASAGAALGALDLLDESPGMGAELLRRAAGFRAKLADAGVAVAREGGPIIPLPAGSSERALEMAARLETAGILAVAIRPPTVPPGRARVRLTVTLAHAPEELDHAAEAVGRAVAGVGKRE